MQEVDRNSGVGGGTRPREAMPTIQSPEWLKLSEFDDEAQFAAAWLSFQCARIAGVKAGLLVIKSDGDGSAAVSATWPEPALDLPDLLALAKRAMAEGRTVVSLGRSDAGQSPVQAVGLLVAVPLGASANTIGVVALVFPISNDGSTLPPEIIAEQVRWGAGWLEAIPLSRALATHRGATARSAASLDVLALAGEHRRLQAVSIAVVNDLANRLGCDRVSIGFARSNGFIRIRAISHSATFPRRSRLIQALANAMEEAVDQNRTVVLPEPVSNDKVTTVCHRALLDEVRVKDSCFATVVLSTQGEQPIGALLFERHRYDPFDAETLQLAEAISILLAPLLAFQLDAERLVSGRLAHTIGDSVRALTGPRRPSLKIGLAAIVAAVLAVTLLPGEHRLTAKAVLEGEVQRAAVAPFDGYIRTAPRRAGDIVQAGELLAKLDDKDLILDQLKWRAELEKLTQKHREALAKHDRIPLALLVHQIRQAESQFALANEKLTRTRIEAPVSGLVVSGDLTQMLGSPVERGKVLFEVAPLDHYRLIIFLDERDIRFIAVGQVGSVILSGSPADALSFEITKVTPVAVPEDGRNTFRIEARPAKTNVPLKPGLEGIAKVDVGSRSLLWIWTHSTLDWLRLFIWKYAY